MAASLQNFRPSVPRGRWQVPTLATLALSLSVILGDVGTVFLLLVVLSLLPRLPRLLAGDAQWPWALAVFFWGAFSLMSTSFVASAKSATDVRFVLNFLPLTLAPIVFLAVRADTKGQPGMLRIGQFALVGAVLAAMIALVQVLVLGDERAGGHVINAIHFANIAMTLGFLALSGSFCATGHKRFLFMLGPVAATMACLLSASRGPLLAHLVVVPAYLAIMYFHSRRTAVIALGALVVLLGLVVMFAGEFADSQLKRISTMYSVIHDALMLGETDDRSTNVRLGLFSAGLKAFQDAPLFGHGWDRIVPAAYEHASDWLRRYLDRRNFTYLHNEPLDFAVGAGLVGLLAYAMMIVAPIAAVLRSGRDGQFLARLFAAIAVSGGFLVYGLTSRLVGHGLQLTLLAVITPLILGYGQQLKANDSQGNAGPSH